MAKNDTPKNVRCSFCGKAQESVRKIVAGPGVYICDECIDLCNSIIEAEIYDEENEKYELGDLLCKSAWPSYDTSKLVDDTYEMVVQVNGKVRGKIEVEIDITKEEMEKQPLNI